jgi:hypothetical protein
MCGLLILMFPSPLAGWKEILQFMLDIWSVLLGVAATLLVFWLRSARPRTKTSVNSQRKLLPHTDDHDRFHSEIQALHMVPEDLEIGPMLGTGTFGQVYRGEMLSHDTMCISPAVPIVLWVHMRVCWDTSHCIFLPHIFLSCLTCCS